MDHSGDTLRQIGIHLGMVNQLYATRMQKMLRNHDLTSVQFALLNHLARHADNPQSISQLTKALEVNQPGVTKIVQKLEALGCLAITNDSADSRKKLLSITPVGFKLIADVMQQLAPDFQHMFSQWSETELADLLKQLQKLGGWLDQHRIN